jgi:hypothetical protein
MLNENQINLENSMIIKKFVNKQIVNCPYCEWSEKFENLIPHFKTHVECKICKPLINSFIEEIKQL